MPLDASNLTGAAVSPPGKLRGQGKQMQGNEEKHKLEVMLIGATGAGKSSTGNTIFYANENQTRNVFEDGDAGGANTETNDTHTKEVLGRTVTITDTPGISNLQDGCENIIKEIKAAIEKADAPLDALLYVVDCFKEDLKLQKTTRQVLEIAEETISKDFWNHVVLVFTHEDTFNERQKQYCNKKNLEIRPFKEFAKRNERSQNEYAIGPFAKGAELVIVENSLAKNPEANRKRIQASVEVLLKAVEAVKEKNNGKGFTKEMLVRNPDFGALNLERPVQEEAAAGVRAEWKPVTMITAGIGLAAMSLAALMYKK